jgi:hypothetical protein
MANDFEEIRMAVRRDLRRLPQVRAVMKFLRKIIAENLASFASDYEAFQILSLLRLIAPHS